MGPYSINDFIGIILSLVAFGCSIWFFVRADTRVAEMRESQVRFNWQKFVDFRNRPVLGRIGPVAGGIFAIVMFDLGITGSFV